MAADLHIHVMTPEMNDDTFRCFFSNVLGGKWWSDSYVCDWKIKRESHFSDQLRILGEEFPNRKGLQKEEVQQRWYELLNEHYEIMGHFCPHENLVFDSPHIWIGEVSWLKAALFDDGGETFIPNTVGTISSLIDDGVTVITDKFIRSVHDAFNEENTTGYSLADPNEVVNFLLKHLGKKVFQVSW